MTLLASTILDSVSGTLLDTAERTWSADEKLAYLNEAMRATAAARPADFYVVENPTLLVSGVIQALPADGILLIDVPRNSETSPNPGRIITQVDKGLLDEAERFWPRGTKQPEVEHFTYDPRNPRRYVCYPPNDGTGIVDLVYGAIPPQIMYPAEELPVPDNYQTPLEQFVIAKCYAKNAKRQDLAKSAAAMQAWGQALSLDSNSIAAASSKVAAEPGTT